MKLKWWPICACVQWLNSQWILNSVHVNFSSSLNWWCVFTLAVHLTLCLVSAPVQMWIRAKCGDVWFRRWSLQKKQEELRQSIIYWDWELNLDLVNSKTVSPQSSEAFSHYGQEKFSKCLEKWKFKHLLLHDSNSLCWGRFCDTVKSSKSATKWN